jgi:ABC-type sugar transport system ATPase subunit
MTNQESRGLELIEVSKSYGAVRALSDVTVNVLPGELHAILGENGAGKSTLIKLITGVVRPTAGEIRLNGTPLAIRSPRAAERAGISYVPQDVVYVPQLSVGRNVLLGREGVFARRDALSGGETDEVNGYLDHLNAGFDASALASDLSVPELRLMQLARALSRPGSVLVLDEPTAVLSESDADLLLDRIEQIRDGGRSIVYVSHRLSEVMRLADCISVLRDGRQVGTFPRGEFDPARIIDLMSKVTGSATRAADTVANADSHFTEDTRPRLVVSGLRLNRRLDDVTFTVRPGEIVGIAGVQGSGHGNLLGAIAGAIRHDGGSIEVDGVALPAGSVRSAFHRGVVLVPADRRRAGIAVGMSISDNIALSAAADPRMRPGGFRRRDVERATARRYITEFAVRAFGPEQISGTLSGGNQQKISLARAIEGRPSVLLIDEPTQGVDVNAKAEIRAALRRLVAEHDCCIVIASSEFEDVLDLADSIHVMRAGRLVASYDRHEATYPELLHHALG